MTKRKPNTYFKFQQFTIFHDKCAMKVGTDGVLLGAWVDVAEANNALDIGTGTGLITLMIAQRNDKLFVDAIDIDNNAVVQAQENFERSPFQNRAEAKLSAVQDYASTKKYDLIVSNPPFFNDSLKSPNKQRTLARHTDSLSAEDLIAASVKLLSSSGRLSVIYPFEYKKRLKKIGEENDLFISRITNVYPTPQSDAKRVLIEFSRREVPLTEDTLIIEKNRHIYSDEFTELVQKFYLNI